LGTMGTRSRREMSQPPRAMRPSLTYSRTMAHAGKSVYRTRAALRTRAQILSAAGSSAFPRSDTWPSRRAASPSKKSLSATQPTRTRSSSRWEPAMAYTMNGNTATRLADRALGRLSQADISG